MQNTTKKACPRFEFLLLGTKEKQAMHSGKYVFTQLIEFLPQKAFQRIVMRYQGDKYIKSFGCWNQLLVMIFGQLSGCESLRELVCIVAAHTPKTYHLGFGKSVITRSNLAKAKSGIKVHTLYDVVTQIPTFFNITEARVHDMNAMDEIPYEPDAYYIFGRGYFDLARLFTINLICSNFVI